MKAALLTGVRQLEIGEIAAPEITSPREVMLQVDTVGVCGSDIHYYTQGGIGSQRLDFPATVGHECAGTVVRVGEAVARVKPGDRVAVDPLICCERCDQCLNGRVHTCRNQRFLGSAGQAPGAILQYLVLPERCCYRVPNNMSMAEAAMAEPFSIGLYAARLAGLRPASKVAILGSGPIGLCVLAACRAEGTSPAYVTDLVSERLAAAKAQGAQWAGNPRETDIVREIREREPLGVDVVFECAGQQETIDQAGELLKPGGTLSIVGIPEIERLSFLVHEFRRHEITIQNVRRQNECTDAAIDLIASGRAPVASLVTHHFSLPETKSAFDLVAGYREGVIKAMIHVSEA